MRRTPVLAALASALLALGAARPAPAAIRVVATIFPVADLVRRVAGPEAEVTVLLPPGASPHAFEPTPGMIRSVAASRVFFMVGAGLEQWAGKLVTAAAAPGLEVVDLSRGLPLITDLQALGPADAEDGDDHGHEGGANPHYWTDPVLALGLVDRIASVLAAEVPGAAAPIAQRAEALRAELRALDAEIRAAVARFRSRRLVTFHNSWPYFARRYGLELAGVIEAAPGREPGPRHLQRIVQRIRELRVPAVFAEPQFPSRAAEVIASEAGVRVLLLDPVGGVPPDRLGYVELMRFNLRALEEGLR